MGHVKTDKLDNGNIGLEITYGGKEAPFGGVDTSAPPAYIDPRCFTASDGFIVVDNKLCIANWQTFSLPTLWSSNAATLLAVGTFFDSVQGQLNYALGVLVTAPIAPPLLWIYKFYLTVWNPQGGIVDNQILGIQLWQNTINPVAATLTFPVIQGETSTFTDSGQLGLNYGVSNAMVGNVNVAYVPGDTVAGRVAALVTALNAASASTLFTAAPTADGFGIVLTASTPGSAGNNLCIADASGSSSMGFHPAFYIPIPQNSGASGWTHLTAGTDVGFIAPPSSFSNVSTTFVGGVLYFANLGPMILKYSLSSTTPGLLISSMYEGVKIIRKFAGSLIGLGVFPALGQVVQNSDMIFAWSAANNLDEWSPVTSAGFVTGAGFAQLADIGDALKGLIVSNNTAFILRAQGISYATALGSGTDPFQFAHIGLGDVGEGAQDTALVCQYDQTGAYVGNTNIFQISGSISEIGQKIKASLFAALENLAILTGSVVCPIFIGGDIYPIVIFYIGGSVFVYNTANGTWQTITFNGSITGNQLAVGVLASNVINANVSSFKAVIVYRDSGTGLIAASNLAEGVSNTDLFYIAPTCTFVQEELVFGRDVTIDSLYIALVADISDIAIIEFLFNGSVFANLVLDPAVFNTISGLPVELQVFPSAPGPFTAHSPQLQIRHVVTPASAMIRFTKLQWYGSFDPNQRPV